MQLAKMASNPKIDILIHRLITVFVESGALCFAAQLIYTLAVASRAPGMMFFAGVAVQVYQAITFHLSESKQKLTAIVNTGSLFHPDNSGRIRQERTPDRACLSDLEVGPDSTDYSQKSYTASFIANDQYRSVPATKVLLENKRGDNETIDSHINIWHTFTSQSTRHIIRE